MWQKIFQFVTIGIGESPEVCNKDKTFNISRKIEQKCNTQDSAA